MNVTVMRYSETKQFGGSTLGIVLVNDVFECYSLEDERRDVKIAGETRIPGGTYKIVFRGYGKHHERYAEQFPDIHLGMLEIVGVPGFTDVLIHKGNTEQHTDGCLLVGDGANNNTLEPAFVSPSTPAYRRLYVKISEALANAEEVHIVFKNIGEEVKA